MLEELQAWWHKCEVAGLSDDNYAKHVEVDSGHGRIETRQCEQVLIDKVRLAKAYPWAGLTSVVKITTEVIDKSTDKQSQEARWYISSLGLDAGQALRGYAPIVR